MPDHEAADAHTDDPVIASCLSVLADRAQRAPDAGNAFRVAMATTWVTTVSSGYCSTDARPIGGQTAILVDHGLVRAVEAAAALIGRHHDGSGFSVEACNDEQRAAFARAHTTFLGQYFLYGRAAESLGVRSGASSVEGSLATEALTFVLSHEIGHVIAGHSTSGETGSGLGPDGVPINRHAVAAEVEADSHAIRLVLADVRDQTVGRADIDARLLAIHSVLQTFQTVEKSALVPVIRRHLPGRQRWDGLADVLSGLVGPGALGRHEQLWDVLAPHLRFASAHELELPRESISSALRSTGWHALDAGAASWARWDGMEAAVWQYRLPRQIVEVLVGYEAGVLLHASQEMGADSYRLGQRAVRELVDRLPRWLCGTDPAHGSASSGDLIMHLRRRETWPEPFRSATSGVLPLHTMASAVRHVLEQ